MNKISTPSMARRHQIEKFTPTPFQPFQPSVWTGRAASGDPDMQVPQNFAESLVCLLPTVLIVF